MKYGKTLTELAMELDRQNNAKKDYLVDTRNMIMDAEPNHAQLSIRNDRTGQTFILDVNEVAHNQIGTTLGIPAKYYDKMRSDNPELLALNVNSWFEKNPKTHMVRTLDGVARAFLSDSYRRIDNYDIAQTVLPILSEVFDVTNPQNSFEVTDERLYLKVVNPRLTTEVVPGDIVQAGILITNSEVGLGSLTIQPLVYRLVCSNGMVVNDAKVRKYHAGKKNEALEDFTLYSSETLMADDRALQLKIRDTVKAVAEQARFEKVVDMMRMAREAKITTTNIPQMVELAAPDFGYTKQEGQGILDYLIRGGDLSLYGFANATTRFAQDVSSYDRSTALESIGYDIMGMSTARWNKLNAAQVMVA